MNSRFVQVPLALRYALRVGFVGHCCVRKRGTSPKKDNDARSRFSDDQAERGALACIMRDSIT